MYKNQLFLIPLFILAINLIEKSSGFVLSHTHYDIKNKYLLNKYSDSKLFAPNKKNIFKNYAKTFMNLHEDDYKNINSTSSDEYIHISESLGDHNSQESIKNEEYFLKTYDESYLNETLNETSIEECNETENQIKQDGFLKKEDFQKYDELFKNNESLAANETINMEYNNIKNDTEMEKQLKTKININY